MQNLATAWFSKGPLIDRYVSLLSMRADQPLTRWPSDKSD